MISGQLRHFRLLLQQLVHIREQLRWRHPQLRGARDGVLELSDVAMACCIPNTEKSYSLRLFGREQGLGSLQLWPIDEARSFGLLDGKLEHVNLKRLLEESSSQGGGRPSPEQCVLCHLSRPLLPCWRERAQASVLELCSRALEGLQSLLGLGEVNLCCQILFLALGDRGLQELDVIRVQCLLEHGDPSLPLFNCTQPLLGLPNELMVVQLRLLGLRQRTLQLDDATSVDGCPQLCPYSSFCLAELIRGLFQDTFAGVVLEVGRHQPRRTGLLDPGPQPGDHPALQGRRQRERGLLLGDELEELFLGMGKHHRIHIRPPCFVEAHGQVVGVDRLPGHRLPESLEG
mmetsp:Transcript_130818/g.326368  ORF Transcript_130818/g.326368 Transcript_130818/m.326368 type:complete len:345 (-) Transcript_130818:1425-2459(-)